MEQRGIKWCALDPYPDKEKITETIHAMRPCGSCRESRPPHTPIPTSPSTPSTLDFTVRSLRHQALQVGFDISVLQGDYQDIGVRYARVAWPTRFDERLPFEVRHQPLELFTQPKPQEKSSFFGEWRMAQWLAETALGRLRDMPHETPNNNVPSMLLGHARTALARARNNLNELDRRVTQHEELERVDREWGTWRNTGTEEQAVLRELAVYQWILTLPETPKALEAGLTLENVAQRLLGYPDAPFSDVPEEVD